MTTAVNISEARVSLIYGETIVGPLAGDLPTAGLPGRHVVERARYEDTFQSARNDRANARLAPPWPAQGRQGFWQRYLENFRNLNDVPASTAWRNQIPLRVAGPIDAVAPVDGARAFTEGFLYPWGIGVVVTIAIPMLRGSIDELVTDVRTTRHETSSEVGHRTTNAVAQAALDLLRAEVFGALGGAAWELDPFTVVTVISGAGASAELDPQRDEIRRLLHALTTFSRNWKEGDPPRDAPPVASRKDVSGGHVTFGSRRGRAIWGIDDLRHPRGEIHSLSCQHRNLVLASIQTEALGALARASADVLERRAFKSDHRAAAKRAVGALGRFYAGTGTYASGSVRAQIEANGWLPAINAVREQFPPMPMLASAP